VLDIGTGSGCLAVTLALQMPEATVVATDVADEVIELAQRNAARFGVTERVEFRSGSLWAPISSDGETESFDVIVSNPPYIPDDQWDTQMDASVKQHTSPRALRGGADGLDLIRPLISGAPQYLTPGGLLAVEIAHVQRDVVVELTEQTGAFEHIDVHKDEDDLWRTLTAVQNV
jgi:release factor glutamine methyltransferase